MPSYDFKQCGHLLNWENIEYPGFVKLHPQEKPTEQHWHVKGYDLSLHESNMGYSGFLNKYVEDFKGESLIAGIAFKQLKDEYVEFTISTKFKNGYNPFDVVYARSIGALS